MPSLIQHTIVPEEGLGEPRGAAIEYILAAGGVFIRAERDNLSILMPWCEREVRALSVVEPYFELKPPRVPLTHLAYMVARALAATGPSGERVEVLFHLLWVAETSTWLCVEPEQEATETTVRPLRDGPGSSYQRALIEVHSHHRMPAAFSVADDRDEQGFRIYGVIGGLETEPEFALRVGVYGHYWPIPAEWAFEDAELLFPNRRCRV